MSAYLNATQVAAEIGISRSALYSLLKREDFPKPYRLHEKARPLYVREEVLAWRETRRAS